ncbi:MAG: EAL domain-containing protein [Rhizobium sp.]|nr:EAL domain-containing protein [Rhizobium sp.]
MTSIDKNNPTELEIPHGHQSLISELVDKAPSALAVVATDTRILYANRSCATHVRGAARLLDVLHPDDRKNVEFLLMRLQLDPSTPKRAEMRLLRADGSDVWMLGDFSAARLDGKGRVEEILIQFADIDSQKRTEADMQSWAQRWNHALVGSTLGVWDHNYATGVFYYSETWKTMRGHAPDAEIDTSMESWIESVHPDDRAMVMDEVERQGRGEDFSPIFAYRERHRAGHYIWIECRGACIDWFEDGTPARVVGTDIDITERKAAEQRLLELSRKLELALGVSQIGVFEVDVQRGVSLWDERMLEMYGLDDGQVSRPADGWFDMIHPDDRARAVGRINEFSGRETTFSNAFRIVRPDGGIRHIRARVTPFRLASGETRIVGANWDATHDITIQEELAEVNRLAEARNRELEAAKAHIEHSALHDFLTGLPNRRYLDRELTERAARAGQGDRGAAILHLDLDRFKQINDTLGHLAGDHMLKHTAKILRQSIAPEDFVARIGGDEFVILSTYDGSTDRLTDLAERVIRRMRDPVPFENHPCRIGASVGIAFACGTAVDPKQLLLNADIALYRAKTLGRNRFEYFSLDLRTDVIQTKRLSDEILAGLERGEFVPHYQLQFHAADLSVAGVETLARWQHPERGLLTPDKFLQVAEDLDVVAAIDKMILDKAVADHALWLREGIDIPKVSVNVSSRRLADPGLGESLRDIRMPEGALSFELLETIFLDDCDEAVNENLRMIRKLGIGIEIDDFGTGHASIVSLLKTGPNTLKIDRELISPLTTAVEQRRLVGSIIEMGRSLGIKVVGEGVETMAHVRILKRLGCDVLQGFALARPMAADRIGPFVREGAWRRPRG